MCGALEFKLSSQQQSCLSLQWSHHQNSRGIEQTFTLIINQPLAAQPAQIAHTGFSHSLCISLHIGLFFTVCPEIQVHLTDMIVKFTVHYKTSGHVFDNHMGRVITNWLLFELFSYG